MGRASHGGDQRTVEAIGGHTLAVAHVHGTGTCRVVRMESTEDMWDSRPLCLDLQVHPR